MFWPTALAEKRSAIESITTGLCGSIEMSLTNPNQPQITDTGMLLPMQCQRDKRPPIE